MLPGAMRCPECGRRYPEGSRRCVDDQTPLSRDPLLGEVIGGRRVEGFLGEGGTGTLYRARHLALERPEALKVLHPVLARDQHLQRRFFQEARIVAALSSPHTVRLYDCGRQDHVIYMLLELLEGQTLAQWLEREGRFPPERAARIIYQVCESLTEAHQAQIIHRDVKPENLMLLPRGADEDFVKVLDFGVARLRSEGACRTAPGLLFGTAAYVSPEQAQGAASLDHRSDLYALGIVLYEMLTGQNPFYEDGASVHETLLRHLGPRPAPPTGPRALVELAMSLLSIKPEQRPEDAQAVQRHLQRAGFVKSAPRGRLEQAWRGLERTRAELEEGKAQLEAREAQLEAREAQLERERAAFEAERRRVVHEITPPVPPATPEVAELALLTTAAHLGDESEAHVQLEPNGAFAVVAGEPSLQGIRATRVFVASLTRFFEETKSPGGDDRWESSRAVTAAKLALLQVQRVIGAAPLQFALLIFRGGQLHTLRTPSALILRLRGAHLQMLGRPCEPSPSQMRAYSEPARDGDLFLLASPGVGHALSEQQLMQVLQRQQDLKARAEALIQTAHRLSRGGPVTALLGECVLAHPLY
ncbi:protein kinase [Myxococcota bacterium]|nr:protein kinase [Myxococcota bacterium]MBU1429325.1 protein kinase [Myxococcota bacterium]MBU1896599.1 protein kinase [Myxococcota bacterium]